MQDIGISELAVRLNAQGAKPPQGAKWTKSLIYTVRLRLSWYQPRHHNELTHTNDELKQRPIELLL